MGKLVILKFDGNWEERGFSVHLTISRELEESDGSYLLASLLEMTRSLPPNPKLASHLQEHWQDKYRKLGAPYRLEAGIIKYGGSVNSLVEECNQSASELCLYLNYWLKSEQFSDIKDELLADLLPDETIRFLIRTEDRLLQKLPWQEWDLIKRYPLAEVGLAPYDNASPKRVDAFKQNSQVRILAILGHSEGLNTKADQELLEKLPNVEITFLVEPQRRDINDQLWEQPWDIIFFAGHSVTEGEKGRIYINPNDSLTINELCYGLTTAVQRGLKLAIFNSCDGLGLAQQLNNLQIPQVIVMRELVPDRVAQEFLKYFLSAFSSGKPFHLAERDARERLQGLQDEFPCATWLPVIFQNPAFKQLSWLDLQGGEQKHQIQKSTWNKGILRRGIMVSVAVTALLMGVRYLGFLQEWELGTYDQMLRLRPDEGIDERLLIVTVTEDDVDYQREMGWEREGSLSHTALAKLLNNLKPHKPRAIGLDIIRDYPAKAEQKDLATQLKQTNNFFAICEHSTFEQAGNQPPPEVSKERLGFNDLVEDEPSKIIRRHLWYMTPNLDSPCPTEVSFSLQLATHYLQAENISPQPNQNGYLQLGNIRLGRLASHAGGYQGIDNGGYQILLNYRTRGDIGKTLTLKQVLNNDFDPNLVKDKIVLIGVTAPSYKDYFNTPFHKDMPGVFIHGQMVSQILSAVLDKRPLLWVLPLWAEGFWILTWALVGGFLAWRCRQKIIYLLPVVVVGTGVLYGFCFIIFLNQGGWIPVVPSALALIIMSGMGAIWMGIFSNQRQTQIFNLTPSS
ncbi:MAG: CHASE2 domain-containing protein [Scytonema sp. PMC 1069.18]|nr:CHASE2 domain-containing protein [Scytonema sp. PMC 1069.18]MEC4884915.1 CHASE2 domain-containing protein [Scytonema sp. PMC 1070.18]